MWHKIVLIVLLLGAATAESITVTCKACACPGGACTVFDGGPFNNDVICGQCTAASQTIDIGCSCSLGCGYSYSADGNQVSGCATSSDERWPLIELGLNTVYAMVGKSGTYDWCGGVCVGPIIGVVVGVLAGVGIIVGVIIYIRKRRATKQKTLLPSS